MFTVGSIQSLVEETLVRHGQDMSAMIVSPDIARELFNRYTSLFELHGKEKSTGIHESEAAFRIHGISVLSNPFFPSGTVEMVQKTEVVKVKNAA